MRFTAFVISTTHSAVTSGARSGDSTTVSVWNRLNGMRKKNIETPNHHEQARREHLAGELRGRRHVDEVVERADDEHHARAEQQADRLGVVDEHLVELRASATRRPSPRGSPTNIAAPPSVGVGFVCTCRASDDGATTAPNRIASQPHDRRQQRASCPARPRRRPRSPSRSRGRSRSLGYGVNFEQRRLAWSRTSDATPSSSTSRSTRPISDAISRISAGAHARGRDRRGAEPQTARDERLLGVVRDRVLVARDARRGRAPPARPCR